MPHCPFRRCLEGFCQLNSVFGGFDRRPNNHFKSLSCFRRIKNVCWTHCGLRHHLVPQASQNRMLGLFIKFVCFVSFSFPFLGVRSLEILEGFSRKDVKGSIFHSNSSTGKKKETNKAVFVQLDWKLYLHAEYRS